MRVSHLLAGLLACSLSFSAAAQNTTLSRSALIERGVALHDEGRYTEALEVYAAARAGDTLNEDVNYEMATTYTAMEKHEQAIRFAELVLRHGKENRTRAAMVKGNALDHLGRTKEAIQTYKDALARGQDDATYLVHYNLALTYYQARIPASARPELMAAISENPSHASSHLMLGMLMAEEGKRVPAVLALTHFLLLESNSRRARGALEALDQQMRRGVTQEDNNHITIQIAPGDKDDDPFRTMEVMMSIMTATDLSREGIAKTPQQSFSANLQIVLGMLEKMDKKESGAFWWKAYGELFSGLIKAGHGETLAYHIRTSEGEPEVEAWLERNPQKMRALSEWYAQVQLRRRRG